MSLQAWSQQKIEWSGRVLDSESNEPVVNAHISFGTTNKGAYANSNGEFSVKLDLEKTHYVEFSSIQHQMKTIQLDEKFISKISNHKIHLDVFLEQSTTTLPGVYVTTKPDTVFKSIKYNVADFCFVDDNMLLLVYEKEKRWKKESESKITLYQGCRLILQDSTGIVLDSLTLVSLAKSFYTGYLDDVFLECKNDRYKVIIEKEQLGIIPMEEEEFNNYFKPIIDSIGNLIYMSSFDPSYPAFEYIVYNTLDSSYNTLHYIIDEGTMEMFRSEYKYLDPRGKLEAFRYELETNIDKEIVAAYMTGFSKTPYYNELFAPIFFHNDTVMIFDHHHDKIFKYDSHNDLVDSVLISYHQTQRRSEWRRKLVQDESNGSMYAVFKRNGYHYLKRINVETGNTEQSFKLHYKHVENIRVKNGEVYYVYRPFESSQKKFLYKELVWDNS